MGIGLKFYRMFMFKFLSFIRDIKESMWTFGKLTLQIFPLLHTNFKDCAACVCLLPTVCQLNWENKVHSWHISITPCVPVRILLRGYFWFPLQCLCRAARRRSCDGRPSWPFQSLMHTASQWGMKEGHVSPFAGMWMPGRQLPLGEVIKQPISFWGHLIVQPAPQSLAALGPIETGSHSSRRE